MKFPFGLYRSALFRHGYSSSLNYIQYKVPAVLFSNYTIDLIYSGPSLSQIHSMLWQYVIEKSPQGQIVECSLSDIAKALGRKCVRQEDRDMVLSHLIDLTKAVVDFRTPNHSWSGSLLGAVSKLERGRVAITPSDGFLGLFENEIAVVAWEDKPCLLSYPLASWLHDYIRTLSDDYTVKVEHLYAISGATSDLRQFRFYLKKAFVKLSPLFVSCDYNAETDSFNLKKKPSRKGSIVLLRGEKKANIDKKVTYISSAQWANSQRAKVQL